MSGESSLKITDVSEKKARPNARDVSTQDLSTLYVFVDVYVLQVPGPIGREHHIEYDGLEWQC